MTPRSCPGVGIAAAMLICSCGPASVGFDAAGLGLPQASSVAPLATSTLYTSPDGGIYQNPDHLEVLLVSHHSVDAVASQLGAAAGSWGTLRPLGDFTFIGLRLRNDGKVSSEPRLNDLQLASDYAPAGSDTGPLRHFYHPTFPLALIADQQPGDSCSVHMDPGHTSLAVLVYPPVRLPPTVVWGRFGSFTLTVPAKGALPSSSTSLRAMSCQPPPVAPR